MNSLRMNSEKKIPFKITSKKILKKKPNQGSKKQTNKQNSIMKTY
jgi:hypothetical protein